MATQKTTKVEHVALQPAEKTNHQPLVVGDLVRATVTPDGAIAVKEALNALKLVDVADVDLLLTFANGDHVIISNGALDALSPNPPNAIFTDKIIGLPELFKLVGVANPAKAGSLRLVSENIDANPPPEENIPQSEQQPDLPQPAPLAKVGAGTSSAGKGAGNGVGAGGGEGEVPATVVPQVVPEAVSYSRGHPTQSVQDLFSNSGISTQAALYTSSAFKVTPTDRTDLPLGAYDPTATTAQLAVRSSPSAQATREIIHGTGGADTIDFNSAFSPSVGQWSKDLHLTFNGYSSLDSVQLVFNAAAILQIGGGDPNGFQLVGPGVTRDTPTSNSWHITPTADMLTKGIDVQIIYNVNDSHAPLNFGADLIVNGHAGQIVVPTDYVNLSFAWLDAVTPADFTVTDDQGNNRMILPRSGVGMEIFAGAGDDLVNAGAGPDLVHGEAGNDTLNAGTGNDTLDGGLGADHMDGGAGIDTATYENAATGVRAGLDNNPSANTNTGEATGDSYANIENLMGSTHDDTLIGNLANNLLSGSGGNDTLIGGYGSDTLDGGTGNNTASYEDAIFAIKADLTAGIGTGDRADGDVYINIQNLIGGTGNDTLIGDANANQLSGGDGNDQLQGMGGGDTLDGGNGTDTVSYAYLTTGVSVNLTTQSGPIGDTLISIENVTGGSGNDTLIGVAGVANVIDGGAGNDSIEGLGGDVTHGDTLLGGAGNDTLKGIGGLDSLVGGADNDTLVEMIGNNTLDGGLGTDTVSYENMGVAVSVDLSGPVGFAVAAGYPSDKLYSIENIVGSSHDDSIKGSAVSNNLQGGIGNDTLEGLGGGDTLDGGAGTDTASYAGITTIDLVPGEPTGVTAVLDATTGYSNTGSARNDVYISIENLVGTQFDDRLVGNSGANSLTGGNGNDTLMGGGGNDTLDGGSGIDTVSYELATTSVKVDFSQNLGTLGMAAGDIYTNIENVIGGTGNDTFISALGVQANAYDGRGGSDTVSYESSAAGVLAKLTSGLPAVVQTNDAAGDTFTSIENLIGTAFADQLIGDANANNLSGGALNDTLEGLAGNDTLDGGTGNDTASYEHATAQVTASLLTNTGTQGDANGDSFISIENLKGSDYYDSLQGSVAANVLTGGVGNDTLQGMGGGDTLDGGVGVDTASYADATTSVTVDLSAGTATRAGSAAVDTLISIENLVGGTADDLFISATTAQVDTYDGGLGNDTVSYVSSNAPIIATLTNGLSGIAANGDASGDIYISIENLTGSNYNDLLIGDTNNNALSGGVGDDTLEGLGGADRLDGGTGNNTATYEHSTLAVIASLTNSAVNTGDAFGDTYVNIQNLTGTALDDALTGDANANILIGGDGNDTLNGGVDLVGSAGDTMNGGNGNDTLISNGIGAVRLNGGTGDDTFILTGDDSTLDIIDGGTNTVGVGDTIVWNASTFNRIDVDMVAKSFFVRSPVTGNTISFSNIENLTVLGNNSIYATLDNYSNVIDATANGSVTQDYVLYQNALGSISADLSNTTTRNVTGGSSVLDNYDAATHTWTGLGDTLKGVEQIYYGSHYADYLKGGTADEWLDGGMGADYIDGGGGTNGVYFWNWLSQPIIASLLPGNVNSALGIVMQDQAAGDTYVNIQMLNSYNSASDYLVGNAGTNQLQSNGVVEGLAGADRLYGNGGTGATVSYAHYGNATLAAFPGGYTSTPSDGVTGITVNLNSVNGNFSNGGNVTATGDAAGDTFNGSIYGLIGSDYNDYLIGNTLNNTISGGLGDDTLEGFSGADTLQGGAGNNTASYLHSNAGVIADLGTPSSNTGDAANDVYINIQNLIGSTKDDTLRGDSNDNILMGGVGNDSMDGGAGFNTISFATATGAEVISLLSKTAIGSDGSDVFNNIQGVIGTTSNDSITGDANNNVIDGGMGRDTLDGGAGEDTLSYVSATGFVNVNLKTGVNTQTDVLSNFEDLLGSLYNDTLVGDDGSNVIDGGASNALLTGVAGNDSLDGGLNTTGIGDTVSYASATAGVTVNLSIATAQNTVGAGTDTIVNFENLTGSSFSDVLTGSAAANIVSGGNGDDILVGSTGGDTLDGGSGTDTLSYINSGAVVVTLNATAVHDGFTDTLSNFENIRGSSSADNITGDAAANVIEGGAGNDTLNGGGGGDTVTYIHAAGAVTVSLAGGTATGADGSDSLSNFANIIGTGFSDSLTGDGSSNLIEGGAGDDTMNGLGGIDTVSYASAGSGVTVSLANAAAQNTGGAGTDTLSNFENITGSSFDDSLTGSNGVANIMNGGDGNDTMAGGSGGGDSFLGGNGSDTVTFAASTGSVVVNLTASGYRGINQSGDAVGDTFSSIENLIGSNFNDSLMGTTSAETITGGLGNDSMWGDSGNDVIFANQGNDWAFGEGDNDTFYVSASLANLPNNIDGGGRTGYVYNTGGNQVVLQNLGASYDIHTLAAKLNNIDTLNIRGDGINTNLTLSTQDIRDINDGANASQIWINTDHGDNVTINIDTAAGQSKAVSSINIPDGRVINDVTIFDSGMNQIAQVHWVAA